jgi:hypothetical protein
MDILTRVGEFIVVRAPEREQLWLTRPVTSAKNGKRSVR